MKRFLTAAALLSGAASAFCQLGPLDVPLVEAVPEDAAWFGAAVAIGDVNGDGYGDAIVGAPFADQGGVLDAGRVVVHLGPSMNATITLQQPVLNLSPHFGSAVAAGDVNGDGVDDVVVGAPDEDALGFFDVGRVYVFLGPTLGAATVIDMPGAGPFSDFGAALAIADFDGDGTNDIAVGSPEATIGIARAGKVFVMTATGTLLQTLSNPTPTNGDQFGWTVSAGDLNGDSRPELFVGEPNAAVAGLVEAGMVHVFDGATFAPLMTLTEPTPEKSAEYGRAVACGDFDGDGVADLAVNVGDAKPLGVVDAGEVWVYRGPTLSAPQQLTEPILEQGADFGWALAAGDANGDGLDDLLVGAQDATGQAINQDHPDAGESFLFFGPSLIPFQQLIPDPVHDDDDFGYAVALGDLNADGIDDALIGARDGEVSGPADQGRAFAFIMQQDLGLSAVGLSAATGGVISMNLAAGVPFAGRPYALLGTTLGSDPGFQNGSVIVPINVDPVITPLLLTILPGALGVLNGTGQATVVLGSPPGVIPPALVGFDFTFAWITTDVFNFASKPVVFEIVP